jgi:hypothetical protein
VVRAQLKKIEELKLIHVDMWDGESDESSPVWVR